jgi:uncharacterized protein
VRIATEDITPILTEVRFREEVSDFNRLLADEGEADHRLASPLRVTLTHLRSGEDLLFNGGIQGELIGQCGRCLEEYPFSLTRQFSVVLTPRPPMDREAELSYDELSASFYSGDTIDVSALVHEQTLLALPTPPLCREDCKGLCPQCGTNRNVEACSCQSAWRDPRLDLLSLRVSTPRTGQ